MLKLQIMHAGACNAYDQPGCDHRMGETVTRREGACSAEADSGVVAMLARTPRGDRSMTITEKQV